MLLTVVTPLGWVDSEAAENVHHMALVVAQLVEQSLPTPEVRGSDPVIHRQTIISDIYLFTLNCIEKIQIKKTRPRMAHFI